MERCEECEQLQWWSGSAELQCAECQRSKLIEREAEDDVEPDALMNVTLAGWNRCEAASPGSWVFYDGEGRVRPPHGGTGVPVGPLPERMWKGWCGDRQGLSHPNTRFSESLERCMERPDPQTLEIQSSLIVPVPWWEMAKRERIRRVLGVEPPLEQGPPPNYQVQLPGQMEGLFEPDRLGETYSKRVLQMEQACVEFARQRQGLEFRVDSVEGGSLGVSYGPDARRVQYRHLVIRNVDGRPEVVTDELPDPYTDMDLEAMLRLMLDCDEESELSFDWEIATEIAVFGMRSMTACQPRTNSWLLYKGGLEQVSFLQTNRDKQRSGYATPRVSSAKRYPRFEPERVHPKSVETVVKPDGTVKHRETTDYGAWRVKARQVWKQWRLRVMMRTARDKQRCPTTRRIGSKGQPGPDSFNACLQDERVGDLKWGSVYLFAEAMDVLLASGVPVDSKNDDMEAFFPQFPLWVMEQWLATQFLDEAGAEVNLRPDFGGGHLPVKTSRANYNVVYCQDVRLWREQRSRAWTLEPWSREMIARADEYMRRRQALGQSGRFWYQFAWVDDISAAALRVFMATVVRVRYQVWEELNWVWDKAKSTWCLCGQRLVPPTVGFELRAAERRMELPEAKIAKYEQAAVALCAAAEQHPRALVLSVRLERVIGQLLHASDVYIEMWIFFMELISSIGADLQLATHTVLSKSARHALRNMMRIMRTSVGRPFTPYVLRPGADGLPVWLTWTDAGRNTRTFEGAIGGYFHLYGVEDVFFFAEPLPVWLVKMADITRMEQHGADVAAALQAQVSKRWAQPGTRDEPAQYLVQTGDSQSVFRFVLNTMRARSRGMRPIIATRWQAEKALRRLVSGVWVPRELNRPADALANLDVAKFVQLMRLQYSDSVRFCRLRVPEHVLLNPALVRSVRSGGSEAGGRE